ncbi:helix-turn-helix domain-containing protein [Streptomyces kronopolitis]|uniref:helix-turn-helix domain-containing protein n=1 Tax=Streptomyces kronopolitis TaxID=1612435 RepID=UPI0020BFFE7E|nr:helix-turn-helix transcriptional regulator [Streptomyces kronopolitis]MCL6302849.1 helix-turn-helix transcriptional regulator [Streptomyces kronopolitis]
MAGPIPEPRYRLVDADLLRRLMARTGTGRGISVRRLAAACGVSHGTINNLAQGKIKTARHDVAQHVCRVIGVDLLILWEPTGRAVPVEGHEALLHLRLAS